MSGGFTIAPVPRDRLGAVAAKHGLKAIKLGYRLNRAYTPKNCMAMAARLTGKTFKARDYDGALAALDEYLAAPMDPRDWPQERSLDYGELTEAEAAEGLGGTIPEPDGRKGDYEYWDNEFGAFWRRPDGSYYYN